MATFTKFNALPKAMAEKVHAFNSDTIKVALTNSAPAATNAVLADITQISSGNGYSSGGSTLSLVSSSQTGGTYKLVLANTTFTATGAWPSFRYAVVYNSTAANGDLICYFDYGSSITMANNESFTVNIDQANGLFTLA